MGETTGIEWASSTVNIWTGCTKVSPACKHCYAESDRAVAALGARVAKGLPMWGVNGYRYETAGWERELRAMNRKDAKERAEYEANGMVAQYGPFPRRRVFINSLSDTFEDWRGPVYRLDGGEPVTWAHSLDDVRKRFFRVAEECTELDILVLTKRPENVREMVPVLWSGSNDFARTVGKWPSHIWIGTTVEDQAHADKRIPELLKVPAKVRFLSVEPLLAKVDLAEWTRCNSCGYTRNDAAVHLDHYLCGDAIPTGIHWVIVGGESGMNARHMNPDWVRKIRDQCQAAGVPFFFKQWGEWAPMVRWTDECGWHYTGSMLKVGKKNAGRVLDGRTWDEVPNE